MDIFKDILDFASDMTNVQNFQTYALAVIGAGTAFFTSLYHEIKKSEKIPLAYAEIENLKSEAKFRGSELGTLTNFLTSVNDTCMQIFESHNASYSKHTKPTMGFGEELYTKLNNKNHGATLQELLSDSEKFAKQSKGKLKEHIELMKDLNSIVADFDKAWREDHTDHYRTEFYTTTESYTDSQGHSQTRVVTKSRQVYDHTEHEYWYDIDAGRQASDKLQTMFKNRPELKKIETFTPATNVSEEGKKSSQESRSIKEKYSEQDFQKFASMWFDGTKHDDDLEEMVEAYGRLESHALHWKDAKETPKAYYNYDTYSSTDNGPREYQIAKSTENLSRNIAGNIGRLVNNIDMVQEKIPQLSSDIQQYIVLTKFFQQAVTSDKIKSPKKEIKVLRKKIIDNVKDMYSTIFAEGIDMDRVKESNILIWGLVGATSGALLGQLSQYISNQPSIFN